MTNTATATRKGRILCAEDDPDICDVVEFALIGEGYEVVTTDTGTEALLLAQSQSFDLFLLDSWLPGMSGEELTKRIREFDSETPILFHSGVGEDSNKESARVAGAQGYLVKPSGMDELINVVARLITNARIALPVKVIPPR